MFEFIRNIFAVYMAYWDAGKRIAVQSKFGWPTHLLPGDLCYRFANLDLRMVVDDDLPLVKFNIYKTTPAVGLFALGKETFVVVNNKALELEERFLHALIVHEIGHFKLNHLDHPIYKRKNAAKLRASGKEEIFLKHELEADEFAAGLGFDILNTLRVHLLNIPGINKVEINTRIEALERKYGKY